MGGKLSKTMTHVSEIPSDWHVTSLGDLAGISTGSVDVNTENKNGKYPFFTCAKSVTYSDNFSFDDEAILISGNGDVGQCHYYKGKFEAYQRTYVLTDFKNIQIQYLFQYLLMKLKKQVGYEKQDGAMPYIKLGFLQNFRISVPPYLEQENIAQLLSSSDIGINKTNQLIAKKELQKKYLMQVLLTGKKRLKGFQAEWKHRKLGDVAKESIARNGGQMTSDLLMAVTKLSGIVPMRERVQGVSFDRCKVIEPNSFAYNPMRINIGSIARWKAAERAMVSGDYVVFRCDETELDPDYLDFFRQTNIWTNFIKRAGDGSVRVRIYFSHLKHLKLNLPPIQEQAAIASVLLAADKEINILKSRVKKLKEQKKWMMQVLLTGKKRLKVVGN